MLNRNVFVLVYLFGFYQICPAIAFAVSNDGHNLTASEINVRPKRFVHLLVIGIAAGIGVRVASEAVKHVVANRHRGKRDANQIEEMNQLINWNYENALALKQEVMELDPEVGKAIHVSRDGFKCDEKFCQEMGNGLNGLGLCSPDVCFCAGKKAIQRKCIEGMVFDFEKSICALPEDLSICAL